jgi:hypothetical protein
MFLRRFVRKIGFDRNQLRRGCDRLETWLVAAVLAVMLVATPILVWHAGAAAYRGAVAESADQRLHRRLSVDAVLLRDSMPRPGAGNYVQPQPNPVPARWLAPDGTARTGTVTPPSFEPAGTRVSIWIDGQGTQTKPPISPSPAADAFAAGLAVAMGAAFGVAVALVAVRGAVNRRRMSRWQLEWMNIEPRWTGRR